MQPTGGIHVTAPLGVVIRRRPGVTRWARWSWQAVAVMPGAPQADWRLLREDGETREYHAATPQLTLWAAEAEAYVANLAARTPCIYVVMREVPARGDAPPLEVVLVTASPYEAQDYTDSGEELVEKVPMPPGLLAWVRDFALAHHHEEPFVKRRRDRARTDKVEDGKGDPRIRQMADIYRAPASLRRAGAPTAEAAPGAKPARCQR